MQILSTVLMRQPPTASLRKLISHKLTTFVCSQSTSFATISAISSAIRLTQLSYQHGRASCSERLYISVRAVSLNNKISVRSRRVPHGRPRVIDITDKGNGKTITL